VWSRRGLPTCAAKVEGLLSPGTRAPHPGGRAYLLGSEGHVANLSLRDWGLAFGVASCILMFEEPRKRFFRILRWLGRL